LQPLILTEGWVVTAESVAQKLESLYTDKEFYKEMSIKAFNSATRPEYLWNNISKQWGQLFDNLSHDKK